MKTLILSDIHGNWPALDAVLQKEKDFDQCLFLGDVADYGPFPNACIEFLRNEMHHGVMGNHDYALAYDADCGCRGDFKTFSVETRHWHRSLVSPEELNFLKSLETTQRTVIDHQSVLMAHASPDGTLNTYLDDKALEAAIRNIDAQIILVGHTHFQFQKQFDNKRVINPGSVGLARDGFGACYATLQDGRVHLCRIPYDVEKTIDGLWQSPISMESKEGLAQVLRASKK